MINEQNKQTNKQDFKALKTNHFKDKQNDNVQWMKA